MQSTQTIVVALILMSMVWITLGVPGLCGVIILFCLYLRWGLYYAIGMAEYVQMNNHPGHETCWDSIAGEMMELLDAMVKLSPKDTFLEFFDVLHSITKYFIIDWMPKSISGNVFTWLFVFPFLLPVSIKLGSRYRQHMCIRNHSNPQNCNHYCRYN